MEGCKFRAPILDAIFCERITDAKLNKTRRWSRFICKIRRKSRNTDHRCRGTKWFDGESDRVSFSCGLPSLIDPLPIPCDFAFLFGRKRSFLLIATKVTQRERERERARRRWSGGGGGAAVI